MFLPETGTINDDKTLKFMHSSKAGKTFTDYFIIEDMEDGFEKAPANVSGTYFFNGTPYKITLKKR